MLASSLSESLGLGMILPMLEIVTRPANQDSPFVQYLDPILRYFSEYYRLLVVGGLLVLFLIFKNVLFILRNAVAVSFTFRLRELWSMGIMKNYMFFQYSRLLNEKQGVLLNNLVNEPGRAAKALQYIIDFSSKLILTFMLYALLLFINWKITLVVTVVAGIVIFILKNVTYQYSIGVGKKKLKLFQDLSGLVAETVSGVRQIKSFSLESKQCQDFHGKLNDLLRTMWKFSVIRNLPKPVIESLVVIGIVFVIIYLEYMTEVPFANIFPVVVIFVVIFQRLIPSVSQLYSDRMNILTFMPSLELVHSLYQTWSDCEEVDRGIIIGSIKEDILFESIHFEYSGAKEVFGGLNLRVPIGKVTAIVGPSGSGKSTVVDLLMGLFKPKKGEIRINGISLEAINLRSWRSMVGYVSQDVFLFNRSIEENIRMGKPDASEEEVVSAARKANAHHFIQDFPAGYKTILGDRGLKISGGQRQRISIARALLKDPEVLILDEALSAVDWESERLIQESINNLLERKTVIVISHRHSAVENADMMYVLDQGKVIDSGSPGEVGRYFGNMR